MEDRDKTVVITASGKKISNVLDNTDDNVIMVPESKARLVYQNHKKAPKLGTVGFWFGVALTCFTVVISTEPKDILSIEGSGRLMNLLLWLLLGVSILLMFFYGIKYFATRNKYSEDAFIRDLQKK